MSGMLNQGNSQSGNGIMGGGYSQPSYGYGYSPMNTGYIIPSGYGNTGYSQPYSQPYAQPYQQPQQGRSKGGVSPIAQTNATATAGRTASPVNQMNPAGTRSVPQTGGTLNPDWVTRNNEWRQTNDYDMPFGPKFI